MEVTATSTWGTGAEKTGENKRPDELGKDEFLKLLVTQLRYQDPLNPMEDKEFIAQMAQFTSLEQMVNLNQNLTGFMQLQELAQASDLIGREVEFYIEDGVVHNGEVERVQFTRDGIELVVKNDEQEFFVGLEQLIGVRS